MHKLLKKGDVPAAPAELAEGGDEQSTEAPESDGDELEEYDDRGMCERDLREEAVSIAHLMTHYPKNPFCKACQRARLRRKANRKRQEPREVTPEFGSCVTLDHVMPTPRQWRALMGHWICWWCTT